MYSDKEYLDCETCGRNEKPEDLHVSSSALGPYSTRSCVECAVRYAEPLWALALVFDLNDGNVVDWVLETITYYEGEYMPFREVLERTSYVPDSSVWDDMYADHTDD